MISSGVTDLTTSSPPPQPKLNTAAITPGDTSTLDEAKQPSTKRKRRYKASSVVDGTSEQSDARRGSVEPHSPPESREATRPAMLERASSSKRKRGHADHELGPADGHSRAASEDRDQPGPLKRHKSDQKDGFKKAPTFSAPVPPVVDALATSDTPKSQKKTENNGSEGQRPKHAKNKDPAGNQEEGELTEAELDNHSAVNGRSSTRRKNRKRSESPSRVIPKASRKRRRKKSNAVSAQKATSDTESVKSSPSHMFFVDLDPTKDAVYEDPEVKSNYRVEQGNLLLPHHVLLETADEQQLTLNAVEAPPTDDTDSGTEDDFQLIENINGFQRYFDQARSYQSEPCETCKQVHSSKICPGLVCHACGVIGQHTANRCPRSIVCFRCSKRGHISRECDTPSEMLRDRRCALCDSQRHNTLNCSLQWRTYVYHTPEERHAELDRRETLQMLMRDNPTSEPIDTEAYVSPDPYCYYCASKGHLGDHCPDPQRQQGCPGEPSSHNLDHLFAGSYGGWYRKMAPELQRLARPGQTLFGDRLVEEEDTTSVGRGFLLNYGRADDVAPFAQPGRAGREKQMQRLVQQHHDDEDNWFDQRRDHGRPRQQPRQQQRPPSRHVEMNYRSGGPSRDDVHYAPPPPLPLPRRPPMVPPPPIYLDRAPAGHRPGPARAYPSPHEISAGYRHARFSPPPPSAPKRGAELSIRGAAQRRQEEDRNQRGGGGGYRSGEHRSGEGRRGAHESSHRDGDRDRRERNRHHNDHRRR